MGSRIELPSTAELAKLREALVAWFDDHRRVLPWRAVPGGPPPDPYAVWVSEVMLQQTRVEVVVDYFQRWMAELPTIEALAHAKEEDVLRLWQGLGYYSRAKRLRQGARYLVRENGGRLFEEAEGLRRVPGIGPYSAGAISSIAFGKQEPLVDGNVIRVLTRLFALAGDPNKSPLKKQLWQLTAELVRGARPGDFNQALMELGATVCTPRAPRCYACPVEQSCQAHLAGRAAEYPQLPKKKPPTRLQAVVVLFRHRGRWLLQKQPDDARWWAGLWTFPFAFEQEGKGQADLCELIAPEALRGDKLPALSHSITRFRIDLQPYLLACAKRPALGEAFHDSAGRAPLQGWYRAGELLGLPMPAPHRKLARLYASDNVSVKRDPTK